MDWTKYSTLSKTEYWLVMGLTGRAGSWAVAEKFTVSGGTLLLNSWNQNATFDETMKSLKISLLVSGVAQWAGYLEGKFGPQLLPKIAPKSPNHWLTIWDIELPYGQFMLKNWSYALRRRYWWFYFQ